MKATIGTDAPARLTVRIGDLVTEDGLSSATQRRRFSCALQRAQTQNVVDASSGDRSTHR